MGVRAREENLGVVNVWRRGDPIFVPAKSKSKTLYLCKTSPQPPQNHRDKRGLALKRAPTSLPDGRLQLP